MRHRLAVVTLAVGMMLEAAAIYQQQKQIAEWKTRGVVRVNLIYQSGCEGQGSDDDETPAGPELQLATFHQRKDNI